MNDDQTTTRAADGLPLCAACMQPVPESEVIRTRRGIFHRGHVPRFRSGNYDPRITKPVANRETRPI